MGDNHTCPPGALAGLCLGDGNHLQRLRGLLGFEAARLDKARVHHIPHTRHGDGSFCDVGCQDHLHRHSNMDKG